MDPCEEAVSRKLSSCALTAVIAILVAIPVIGCTITILGFYLDILVSSNGKPCDPCEYNTFRLDSPIFDDETSLRNMALAIQVMASAACVTAYTSALVGVKRFIAAVLTTLLHMAVFSCSIVFAKRVEKIDYCTDNKAQVYCDPSDVDAPNATGATLLTFGAGLVGIIPCWLYVALQYPPLVSFSGGNNSSRERSGPDASQTIREMEIPEGRA